MQIDPETTVVQSGLQVYSLNSDLKAAVPSKSHRSQVSLFFPGGGVTVDVHIDNM
jgi:hypothetical protein